MKSRVKFNVLNAILFPASLSSSEESSEVPGQCTTGCNNFLFPFLLLDCLPPPPTLSFATLLPLEFNVTLLPSSNEVGKLGTCVINILSLSPIVCEKDATIVAVSSALPALPPSMLLLLAAPLPPFFLFLLFFLEDLEDRASIPCNESTVIVMSIVFFSCCCCGGGFELELELSAVGVVVDEERG